MTGPSQTGAPQTGERQAPPRGLLLRLAEGLALTGGIIAIAMALFTATGISWRAIFGRAITGDFEIVQVLSAWSVFFFFPYAQIVRQHVAVDFVTDRLPLAIRRVLRPLTDLLVALVAAVIGWRVCAGMMDAIEYNDISMMLRLPMWITFVPGIIGWFGMALIALAQALGLIGTAPKP